MSIVTECQSGYELDRLERAAIDLDSRLFTVAIHEASHAFIGLSLSKKFSRMRIMPVASSDEFAAETLSPNMSVDDLTAFLGAGHAGTLALCGHLMTREMMQEMSAKDFRDATDAGCDQDEFTAQIDASCECISKFRDSVVCIALESIVRRGEYLTFGDVNRLYEFGYALPRDQPAAWGAVASARQTVAGYARQPVPAGTPRWAGGW
jgi:hypothetical protein